MFTMIKRLGFVEAAEYLADSIVFENSTGNKPFIINLHGYPDSGKRDLSKAVRELLMQKGIIGWTGNAGEDSDYFRDFIAHHNPSYFIFKDVPINNSAARYVNETFNKNPDLKIIITSGYDTEVIEHPMVIDEIANKQYDLIVDNSKPKKKTA